MSADNLVYLQQGKDGKWRAWHGFASDDSDQTLPSKGLIAETESRAEAIVTAHDWTTKNYTEYGVVELKPLAGPSAPCVGPAMTLPPLPELPTLDCTNTARVLFVRWATQYGQDCAKDAMESCRKLCDDYSKHLIATGEPSTPSEWEAHGAESCANLIGGLSEYGDQPESEHFAGTYADIRAAKQGEQG